MDSDDTDSDNNSSIEEYYEIDHTPNQRKIHEMQRKRHISTYPYEYEDEKGNFYQVVKKACQNVDPPSVVLPLPRFSHGNGKLTLLDDYGNEYEMVQLPKSIEHSGKGEDPSSMSPLRASLGVPPSFDQAKTQATNDSHAPMSPISKVIEERTNQVNKYSHIKITLVFEKTIVFVSANVDPKRSQSIVSYEVWEALGKPTLTPLEPQDRECMESIILKVKIQLQPMYCTFHLANPCRTAEHVTLGWYWMCRTDYQEDKKDNAYTVKERSTKQPKSVQESISSECFFNGNGNSHSGSTTINKEGHIQGACDASDYDHSRRPF
ncbi:hypothetical protein GOP47_0022016 [Adiantum capillus-veneris]|uniref:Uncharacterized protein n=1 Tax=Adiantum capillus-veneris TaxID=13818 RepID=A0A9D4U8J0_ADICA|nr:hypothetical protein GOP47_0022016 [Adiantum capillus-veneris]